MSAIENLDTNFVVSPQLEYALVLPTYNEASRREGIFRDTIETYQSGLKDYFGDNKDWELVVADDGSVDHTLDVVKDYELPVIQHPDRRNHGRGAVLKLAFPILASHANIVAFTDADGSYSLESIFAQLQSIKDGADIAVAKRPESLAQHEDMLRLFGHTALNRICEFIAPTGASDPQAGLQTYKRESATMLWPQVRSERWAATREVLFLAHKLRSSGDINLIISENEAPVIPKEESSVHVLKDSIKMIRDSIVMRRQKTKILTGRHPIASISNIANYRSHTTGYSV